MHLFYLPQKAVLLKGLNYSLLCMMQNASEFVVLESFLHYFILQFYDLLNVSCSSTEI